jgi:hypothetical protein
MNYGYDAVVLIKYGIPKTFTLHHDNANHLISAPIGLADIHKPYWLGCLCDI